MSLENGKVGITLIGMPGSGKSALGRRLNMPGWTFHDQDNHGFENPSVGRGKNGVANTLRLLGDKQFLEFENNFTINHYGRANEGKDFVFDNMIFSSSGSLPRSPEAMKYIRERTHVILLDMPIDVVSGNIKKREDGATRIVGMNGGPFGELPMHATIEEELRFRENLYKSNCDSIFPYPKWEEIQVRVKRFRTFLEKIL